MSNQINASKISMRLKQLRKEKGKTFGQLSKDLLSIYGLKICSRQLGNYEVDVLDEGYHTKSRSVCGMATRTLYILADYYGVSTDYILGLTHIKSADVSLKDISIKTGLNDEIIEILCTNNYADSKKYLSFLLNLIGTDGSQLYKDILKYLLSHYIQFQGVSKIESLLSGKHKSDIPLIALKSEFMNDIELIGFGKFGVYEECNDFVEGATLKAVELSLIRLKNLVIEKTNDIINSTVN